MSALVLTVIGDDRPGLVSAVSAVVSARGASWEQSQMARLGGKFAGILLVDVPEGQTSALTEDLRALEAEGLHVSVEPAGEPAEDEVARLRLDLLGADRSGIVAEISAALADRGVGIEELSTGVREAPMAGGMLFEASAVLAAPPTVGGDELRRVLEALADELMVEISLSD